MPGDAEVAIGMRNFTGVNVALDPCFLGTSDLQRAENWAPFDLTGTITTRRGTGSIPLTFGTSTNITRLVGLLRTYDTAVPPNRLLFGIAHRNTLSDQLFVNVNDNQSAGPVVGGAPFTAGSAYGMAVLGNKLYVSNGVDQFIKVVDLSTPFVAFDLGALGVTNTTGSSAVAVASGGTPLDAGTYAYAWGVYDTTTKFFVSRGAAQLLTIDANNQIRFTAPSGALGAGQVYQLFVALVNLPVEFATAQCAAGLAPSGTFLLDVVDQNGPRVPLDGNVARTGNILLAHLGRLWIAGDQANPSKVYCTGPIEPGTEQEQFDLGDFFPALAVDNVEINDGDVVTGLAVASLTTTQQSPSAPLAIFKTTSTFLAQGSLDSEAYTRIQLSRRLGCLSNRTIAHTPAGTIFCGLESVYLLPTALQEPVDIGWPISPIIRGIAETSRTLCFALYHNQFYKLFLVPPGSTDVTQEWWLDLHQGSVGTPPSWWGPMTHNDLAYSAATNGQREPDVDDQAWAALSTQLPLEPVVWNRTWNRTWGKGLSIGDTLPLDDPTSTSDANMFPIQAQLTTKRHDMGAPFQRKLFVGVRAIAKAAAPSTISVTVRYDGGPTTSPAPLTIGNHVVQWTKAWDRVWGTSLFQEGDTRLLSSLDRQPHLTADVSLTTPPGIRVDLRDAELRFLPVVRPVA